MSETQQVVGYGKITWLGINTTKSGFSRSRERITFLPDGIKGDRYRGFTRQLSDHDGEYIKTSNLAKGDTVLNWRPVTGLEENQVSAAQDEIGQIAGPGMLRENLRLSLQWTLHGLNFSMLPARSRLVIGHKRRVVLECTEENSPCAGVARPFADHYDNRNLIKPFIQGFCGRRGQMIMVQAAGTIRLDDPVRVYLPVT